MTQFVPSFKCKYCGETKDSIVDGELGLFIPCDCAEARTQRDRDHYLDMELRKVARRNAR